jgi:hypothetical protein
MIECDCYTTAGGVCTKCHRTAREKQLEAAARKLSFLNQCELEGISYGMPDPEEWAKAFEELDKLLAGEES